MTSPIKPSHHICLWVTDEILYAELPNPQGDTSHTLRLPNNVWGLTQAINILKVRNENSRLGERGDPTQAQAEAEMKRLAKGIDPNMITRPRSVVKITPKLRASAQNILRRFGIS